MASFKLDGKVYETDEEGYMMDWRQWNKKVAEHIAKSEGVVLTDPHWEIITLLREYYKEHGISPMIRILAKTTCKKLGAQKGNTKYLYGLYPNDPSRSGCKIAGLPKSTGCR